jgi:two-component system response regulator (stage 0 sporulation protein F)
MQARRILIVDDEEPIRLLMSNVFRSAGYAVDVAANGSEAMAKIQSPPDLVTMDLAMPGMSGWELIETICARPQAPAVVIVSGHIDVDTHPLMSCVAGVVNKPFMPRELVDVCNAVLRGRGESKSADPGVERRRVPRRDFVMDIRVAANVGNPLVTGRVVDLSPLGAEIEVPSQMNAGQSLRLALRFPGRSRPVLVDGKIQYCAHRGTGAWSCGLEFANVNPDLQRELSTLLSIPSPSLH